MRFMVFCLYVTCKRETKIGDTAARAVVMCIRAMAEAAMVAVQPTPVPAVVATPGAPGRLVDALKPGILTLDASPIELRPWKRKLVTYLRCSGVPGYRDITDLRAQCVLWVHGVRGGGHSHAPPPPQPLGKFSLLDGSCLAFFWSSRHVGGQRAAVLVQGVLGAVSEKGDHNRDLQPLQSTFKRSGRVCGEELQKALRRMH